MENTDSNLFFDQGMTGETTTHVSGQSEPGVEHAVIPGLTSIIVACYNTSYPLYHYTGHAIGSIHEHTDPESTPYELIVVDNGSPVRHSKMGDYNADKIIQNETNLGVAAAWNQGIRASQGEYIALINSDAMVFGHWLEDMQEALGHVDLVMSHPMYGEPWSRAREARKRRQALTDKPITESFSFFKDFSCVLIKRSVFDQIGLFDEDFFIYYEDADLIKRLEQAGLKWACCERVATFHIIGATSLGQDDTAEQMNKSRQHYKSKWGE